MNDDYLLDAMTEAHFAGAAHAAYFVTTMVYEGEVSEDELRSASTLAVRRMREDEDYMAHLRDYLVKALAEHRALAVERMGRRGT